ncbi:MAG TPA: HEAT repeat domain-containing protein [Caldilineaceae bacterium]|nr:HEAT repeat domain-containing protein [Caldilineaceae bacterium]
MSHVYLSYAHSDKDYADIIEAELTERGHSTWRDTSQIENGADWGDAIKAALHDAYAILVLLSFDALQSEWVQNEMRFAHEHHVPIVIVQIEECVLPTELENAPQVNLQRLRELQGIEQLNLYRQSMSTLISLVEETRPVLRHLRALASPDDLIREHAAQRLGELGDPIATQALIRTLTDPDVDVRFASAEALGKLRSESALRPLIRTLADDDPDVLAAAAAALGELGLPDAISQLDELLSHHDRFVRAAAALALGKLDAINTVRTLIFLMRNDSIGDVRRAAAHALCTIGGSEAERALKRAGIHCADLH